MTHSSPPPDPAAPSAPVPHNRILAALPAADLARLAPSLERVEFGLREVLFDVNRPLEHVHFPERGVVSVLSVMSDGTAVETGTVGSEGMVGLHLFHGTDQASAQAFCQIPGEALRMRADVFRAEVAEGTPLARHLHRYTQAFVTFIAQSSACNRLHTMRERCARWLLHTHDRVGAAEGVHEFPLTHQFLSQMLGVRRATVTETLGMLRRARAITYATGTITVDDRSRLEAQACECYAIIQSEFDRLLGGPGRRDNPLDGVTTSDHGRTTLRDGVPRRAPGEPDPDDERDAARAEEAAR